MAKDKTKKLSELKFIVRNYKDEGKLVGLITGCFDVVHIDHIALFKNAKEKVDILTVGLENDKTIKRSKGPHRPINNQKNRALFLEAITYIDYVFLIDDIYDYSNSEEAIKHYRSLVKELSPNFLMTNKRNDSSWKNKQLLLVGSDIKLVNIENAREETSTSIIEQKLLEQL